MNKRWHDINNQTKVKVAFNMVQMSKTGAQNTDSIVSGSVSYSHISCSSGSFSYSHISCSSGSSPIHTCPLLLEVYTIQHAIWITPAFKRRTILTSKQTCAVPCSFHTNNGTRNQPLPVLLIPSFYPKVPLSPRPHGYICRGQLVILCF